MKLRLDGLAIDDSGAGAAAYAAAVAAARAAAPGLPLVLLSARPGRASRPPSSGGAAADKPLVGRGHAGQLAGHGRSSRPSTAARSIVGAEGGDLQTPGRGVASRCAAPGSKTSSSTPAPPSLAGDLAAFTQLRRLALKKNERALGLSHPRRGARELAAGRARARRAGDRQVRRGRSCSTPSTRRSSTRCSPCARTSTPTPRSPSRSSPSSTPSAPPARTARCSSPRTSRSRTSRVSGEVEGSGKPAWLLVADADGQSVLTGWAAGKFDAEKIAKRSSSRASKTGSTTRSSSSPAWSPGCPARSRRSCPGWQIMVGPRDAVDIPTYLKNVWSA